MRTILLINNRTYELNLKKKLSAVENIVGMCLDRTQFMIITARIEQ